MTHYSSSPPQKKRARVRTHTCTHPNKQTSQIQPEDHSKKPKHVDESCQFIKYLIKSCVGLYFITLINNLTITSKHIQPTFND